MVGLRLVAIPLLTASLLSAPDNGQALRQAASQGKLSVVQQLIAQSVPVNEADKDGRTALMNAAEKGRVDVVKVLLAAGADVPMKDDKGNTAAILAFKGHYVKILSLLPVAILANEDGYARLNGIDESKGLPEQTPPGGYSFSGNSQKFTAELKPGRHTLTVCADAFPTVLGALANVWFRCAAEKPILIDVTSGHVYLMKVKTDYKKSYWRVWIEDAAGESATAAVVGEAEGAMVATCLASSRVTCK